eukprot:gene13440-14822_t
MNVNCVSSGESSGFMTGVTESFDRNNNKQSSEVQQKLDTHDPLKIPVLNGVEEDMKCSDFVKDAEVKNYTSETTVLEDHLLSLSDVDFQVNNAKRIITKIVYHKSVAESAD